MKVHDDAQEKSAEHLPVTQDTTDSEVVRFSPFFFYSSDLGFMITSWLKAKQPKKHNKPQQQQKQEVLIVPGKKQKPLGFQDKEPDFWSVWR